MTRTTPLPSAARYSPVWLPSPTGVLGPRERRHILLGDFWGSHTQDDIALALQMPTSVGGPWAVATDGSGPALLQISPTTRYLALALDTTTAWASGDSL